MQGYWFGAAISWVCMCRRATSFTSHDLHTHPAPDYGTVHQLSHKCMPIKQNSSPPIEEIPEILHRLEAAVRDHASWLMEWHRAIICTLPLGDEFMRDDAYRLCRFGQWYMEEKRIDVYLSHWPIFEQIDNVHRRLHESARELAQRLSTDMSITAQEYDDFLTIRTEFRELLRLLEKDLQDILYHTDPLTHVYNRQNMLVLLNRLMQLAIMENKLFVLTMIDIDNFKIINDTYGHLIGDDVLKQFTKFFMDRLRPSDLIFRYGGEEFLVCLQDTSLNEATQIMDRLRRGLRKKPILLSAGNTLHVTSSFGLAVFEKGLDLETLIDRADKALYAAKKAGRDRVCTWEAQI